MLVDTSGRIWAMRRDNALMTAETLQQREKRPQAQESGARVLDGSEFAVVVGDVAVIPVRGMLMRKQSFFFWSYEEIGRDIALAQEDSGVRSIVLDIDSPGGLASGCADLAAEIAAGDGKPVHAFVGGMAASAAYWIASACASITCGSGSVLGSIGTVIEYIDIEPILEAMGAKIVRVVAEQSPNKRLDPDSAEGRAELQALVDSGGAEFVTAVAAGRGVSEATVMDRFGQGLVFDAGEAIARGMADARGTLSTLIADLADRGTFNAAPAPAAEENSMDWNDLTEAGLREHRADLVESIAAEAQAKAKGDGKAETDRLIAEAVEAERARIAAIDEVAIAGHDDLVAAAKAEGTSADALATQILKAEKASGSRYLADRAAADGQVAVAPTTPASAAESAPSREADPEARWDKDADLRAEFGGNKDAFMAWSKADGAGRVRVLSHRN